MGTLDPLRDSAPPWAALFSLSKGGPVTPQWWGWALWVGGWDFQGVLGMKTEGGEVWADPGVPTSLRLPPYLRCGF